MKKTLAVIIAVFAVAGLLAGQAPSNVGVANSAQFSHDSYNQASSTFGFYNLVTFEAKTPDGVTYFKMTKHNLTTNAGKDVIKQQVANNGSQPAACSYIAVSTSAITPAVGDTSLTGEVSTNGLARALGTYASTGTGTWTLSKTFTATGAVSNVQAAAVFNAASGTTMCFEVGSLGPVTLATNDTLTVTWSGTIS